MEQSSIYQRLGLESDLAIEAHELLRGEAQREVLGVREDKETFQAATVTTVTILNEIGERAMGKPQGTYITIEAPSLGKSDGEAHQQITNIIADKISLLLARLGLSPQDPVLMVGLGNWDATPDALGPRVAGYSLVTRHLKLYAPAATSNLRSVSALSPGVLGSTGIESAEIIKGVVERTRPRAVIAIDALAAHNVSRIGSTIQICDTGLSPGSGVGNKRLALNRESLDVPVIAIGVPTVVSAAVIIREAIEKVARINPGLAPSLRQEKALHSALEVLQPFAGNLTVTPKEIDDIISNTSKVIADGLNQGLHSQPNPATPGTGA